MNDREFWTQVWLGGRTGFHRDAVHPDLPEYAARFLGGAPRRVLVPLCGKSLDLVWLRDHGHEVVGVEIVEHALEAFCEEQGLGAEEHSGPHGRVLRSQGLTLVCADFFAIGPEDVGPVDRIWDRAALVALPPERRIDYAAQERRLLAPGGRILLNAFEYDPSQMSGPPFSVPRDEVAALYPGTTATLLDEAQLGGHPGFERHDHFVVHTWLFEA